MMQAEAQSNNPDRGILSVPDNATPKQRIDRFIRSVQNVSDNPERFAPQPDGSPSYYARAVCNSEKWGAYFDYPEEAAPLLMRILPVKEITPVTNNPDEHYVKYKTTVRTFEGDTLSFMTYNILISINDEGLIETGMSMELDDPVAGTWELLGSLLDELNARHQSMLQTDWKDAEDVLAAYLQYWGSTRRNRTADFAETEDRFEGIISAQNNCGKFIRSRQDLAMANRALYNKCKGYPTLAQLYTGYLTRADMRWTPDDGPEKLMPVLQMQDRINKVIEQGDAGDYNRYAGAPPELSLNSLLALAPETVRTPQETEEARPVTAGQTDAAKVAQNKKTVSDDSAVAKKKEVAKKEDSHARKTAKKETPRNTAVKKTPSAPRKKNGDEGPLGNASGRHLCRQCHQSFFLQGSQPVLRHPRFHRFSERASLSGRRRRYPDNAQE